MKVANYFIILTGALAEEGVVGTMAPNMSKGEVEMKKHLTKRNISIFLFGFISYFIISSIVRLFI